MENIAKNIALIGHGTIGRGVAEILLKDTERIARAVREEVRLVKVCDKDAAQAAQLPPGIFTSDVKSIIDDSSIDTAIELIGGLEPARTLILQLLQSGKNVVTANKALLAHHGKELFDAARAAKRTLTLEAAVAGGIPIVNSLATSLQANTLRSVRGILNGTSNFILSAMNASNESYAEAVQLAQKLGYAEANPAMDVDGSDAAQKLAILAQLAWGVQVDWREIPRQGITAVEPLDFQYAEEFGYIIKLIAAAEMTPRGLSLSVAPTLVDEENMLANVDGANNAIEVIGNHVGKLFYYGAGAGQFPTASAVVSDVIDTLTGRASLTFEKLALWSEDTSCVKIESPKEMVSRAYLRMEALDRPGVLGEITTLIGRHKISVASVLQHDLLQDEDEIDSAEKVADDSTTPVMLLTHPATESQFVAAIDELQKLGCVRSEVARFRVQ